MSASSIQLSPHALWFSLLLLLFGGPVSADARANEIDSLLKRAEATLQLVDGSIGRATSPPKGSAAKLARMRLGQASADLDAAGKLVGDGAAKGRYDAAVALRDKLQGILDGGAAPAKTPPSSAAPEPARDTATSGTPSSGANATVKLGYPHADAFKNALFTLRRVEADAAALESLREALQPVQDQLSVDHRKTAGAMASVTETRRQAGFVRDALGGIPSNGEGVADAVQRLSDAEATLTASERYFQPLHAKLMELVDPRNYPEFQQDLRRLQELSSMYRDPATLFAEQRARAAEAIAQSDATEQECRRIAKTYARLMEQATEQGKQIQGAGNHLLQQRAAFLAAAEEQKVSLPASIRADLAEADRYADDAVQNRKPLWFTGGIPQRLGWVDEKLALYETLDPGGASKMRGEVAAMKASIESRADSLRDLIIRENTLPADSFAGGDRDAAIAVAIDAWKAHEPDMELLAVRIPATAWSRESKWTYGAGSWTFVDQSSLQVRLIVADKRSPELAIDRPVTVRKNHEKGDAMIGIPLRSFDETLTPGEYLLRDKIR